MATVIDIRAIRRNHRFQAENMLRLVENARNAGIRILVIEKTGKHVAIDPVMPWAHEVDRTGCDCQRFGIFGRCEHQALLLSELGLLEDPNEIGWPDDDPPAAMAAD